MASDPKPLLLGCTLHTHFPEALHPQKPGMSTLFPSAFLDKPVHLSGLLWPPH